MVPYLLVDSELGGQVNRGEIPAPYVWRIAEGAIRGIIGAASDAPAFAQSLASVDPHGAQRGRG